MRILMVSDVYFPRVNGVSTSIETFRQSLAGQGIEVRIVAPRYGAEPDVPGVARVPGRPVPRDPEDRIVAWRSMSRTVHEHAAGCDLVHIQTPFAAHYSGLRAARRAGLPVLQPSTTRSGETLHHSPPSRPPAGRAPLRRPPPRRQRNPLSASVVPRRRSRPAVGP